MIRPTHTYIGRCKHCGLVLSSVYDMADDPKFTSGTVAEMIAAGLTVERVPLGSVEIAVDPCHCWRNPVADLPLFEKEPTP